MAVSLSPLHQTTDMPSWSGSGIFFWGSSRRHWGSSPPIHHLLFPPRLFTTMEQGSDDETVGRPGEERAALVIPISLERMMHIHHHHAPLHRLFVARSKTPRSDRSTLDPHAAQSRASSLWLVGVTNPLSRCR